MIARLEVAPGPGIVIRYGHVVAWTSPDASASLLAFLIESARNLAGSPEAGQILVDHLASVLSAGDPEPQVGFAVAGPSHARWVGIVHGPAQAWDGASWTTTRQQPGWARIVCTPTPALTLNGAGSDLPEGSPSSVLDLEAGVVPGGGVTLWPDAAVEKVASRGSATGESATDQAGPNDADITLPVTRALVDVETDALDSAEIDLSYPPSTDPAVVIDLRPAPDGAGTSKAVALPPVGVPHLTSGRYITVEGVRCHRGHLNRSGMIFCAVCSSPIRDGEESPGPGPRPPLGCLITADGSVFGLDTDYIVGPEGDLAEQPPAVADPTPRARGATGRSSRQLYVGSNPSKQGRAEILLENWDVVIVDGGSEVGTYLYPPGASAWQRMPPRTKTVLAPGSHISFGRDVVTYINPWVPAVSTTDTTTMSTSTTPKSTTDAWTPEQ